MTHLLMRIASDPTNQLHRLKRSAYLFLFFLYILAVDLDNGLQQKCVDESCLILKAVVSGHLGARPQALQRPANTVLIIL